MGTLISCVGLEVHTVAVMKSTVFWDITLCNLLKERFRGTCCPGLEVHTVAVMKSTIFWDITPWIYRSFSHWRLLSSGMWVTLCSLVDHYQRFGKNLCSWQAKLLISLLLVLLFDPAGGSCTSIWNIGGYLLDYMTSTPEDSASHSQCREDLRSNIIDGCLPNKAWC
jgi:hypothetical protein